MRQHYLFSEKAVYTKEETVSTWHGLFKTGKKSTSSLYTVLCLFNLHAETSSVQFSHAVVPDSFDPTNHSMLGIPVHHKLPQTTQTHVHWVSISSNCLILSHPLLLLPSSFPSIGVLSKELLFISGCQSIGILSSTQVLPVNTQDWLPLGWTAWISLQSKRLSRGFSNTTVQKHRFFCAQFSL